MAHGKRVRMTARQQVWAYGLIAVVAIGIFSVVSIHPLDLGADEVRRVRRDDLAVRQMLDFRATQADMQIYIEPLLARLSPLGTTFDPTQISEGGRLEALEKSQGKAAIRTLTLVGLGRNGRDITIANAGFIAGLDALGPLIGGRPTEEIVAAVAAERAAFVRVRAVTAAAAAQLREQSDLDSRQSLSHLDDGRATIQVVDAIAAILVVGAAIIVGRRARRREKRERMTALGQEYESTLQQALEMSQTEADTYKVMTRALQESVPHLQVEMLVADSSRAHFRQTFNTFGAETDEEPRSGCGVVSPLDCPATMRGRTLVFPTSSALNACPHLTGRESGALSAACVAISITGKTVGVVHATGPDGEPPSEAEIQYLETTTRRASDRIAMLRAFEKSEAQARTDPLTGLWNRRSLENRVNDLQREGSPYAVAYGDLDHFKELNDTYGHETGDQALRLFARVLRDATRPTDITARYGGEEFIIVLPDCTVETATKTLERLRERLALTVSAGRVPPFTVSFGVASSLEADSFDEVVALADQALLAAKAAGRNRTVHGRAEGSSGVRPG